MKSQHIFSNIDSFKATLSDIKNRGKTICFTNGCFDLLHPGHIQCLNESKCLADILIVGLNTDSSIRRIKGESRPIESELVRAKNLVDQQVVNYIVLFNEDTPFKLIQAIRPDVITKGGDYREEELIGRNFVYSYGGQCKVVSYLPGYSTSSQLDSHKKKMK